MTGRRDGHRQHISPAIRAKAQTSETRLMKTISQWFFQGLIALLPVGVTIAVIYWLGVTAENTLGRLLKYVLPDQWYIPGMGIVSGFLFVIVMGLLVNAYLFRKLGQVTERLFSRIPLVRIIYSSVRDIAKFASASQREDELQSVVLVTLTDDMEVIGFVTDKQITFVDGEARYAVYLPMSYQMGGYTLFLPPSKLHKLDMSIQDAMRYVVTAGMAGPLEIKT